MKTIILLIALVLSNLGFSCVILPNGNYVPCDAKVMGEIAIEQSAKYSLKYLGYDKTLIENEKFIKALVKNEIVIPQSQPARGCQIDKNFLNALTRLFNKTTNKLGFYRPKEYSNFLKEFDKLQTDIINTDKYDTEKMAQLKIRFENLKAESETLISTASRREKFPKLPYIKR